MGAHLRTSRSQSWRTLGSKGQLADPIGDREVVVGSRKSQWSLREDLRVKSWLVGLFSVHVLGGRRWFDLVGREAADRGSSWRDPA